MEALWNLEDKWKLSTKKSLALFACTVLLFLGTCVLVAMLIKCRKKKTRKRREIACNNNNDQEPCKNICPSARNNNPLLYRSHCLVKEVLKGSTRWSGSIKWNDEEESLRERNNDNNSNVVVVRRENDLTSSQHAAGCWESHNSASAVWQRPILMGEKCELPTFSGLILYDQRGVPLNTCFEDHHHQQAAGFIHQQQEDDDSSCVAERTTLRDLF